MAKLVMEVLATPRALVSDDVVRATNYKKAPAIGIAGACMDLFLG
jgi:hypothetical protein